MRNSPWRRGTGSKAAGFRPRVDALEDRSVPSNLVWTNRGQADDRFVAVFGDRAEAARRVVDYCLASWGRVIVNLNQPAIDEYRLTVPLEAPAAAPAAATK